MCGPYVMCAEGFDNGCDVDFTIAAQPDLRMDGENVVGLRADGGEFKLIPYYKWCRRESGVQEERRMNVWFRQEAMTDAETLAGAMGGKLYEDYESC